MKLLLSWARDFVDITATAREVADTMALRGFEVSSIEPVGTDDAVIDFEVTANRPDCLSVVGLSREIATAFDSPFRDLPSHSAALAAINVGTTDGLSVSIDAPALCPRYAAVVAEVTPAHTPEWMSARLAAAGVRPISALVDITNYVLLELGQPMHAFDLDTLAGAAIRVRRATAGEKIVTLDGVERALDPEMLVIADAQRPQAVAGVMGGLASEVSARTTRIAFESAFFAPASVRRTSKRLNLKTEASARFERGADVTAPVLGLRRAIALMQQIGAGRVVGSALDVYPGSHVPRQLELRRARLDLLLGQSVPDADVLRILRGLGFDPTTTATGWQVTVPGRRVDVTREVDLIEEVGRHHGFDKLEATFPVMRQAAPATDPRIERDGVVRQVLTSAGITEAVTFGFIARKAAEAFVTTDGVDAIVPVANPLSATFEVLRPSLLPGLVDSLAHNRRHGRRDVALFEVGARFRRDTGERRSAALAWTGSTPEHWSAPPRVIDFFDVKGTLEALCAALAVEPVWEPVTVPYLVDGQSASLVVGGEAVGVLGVLTPDLAERAGAPRHDSVLVAEVDLDRVMAHRSANAEWVKPLSRHPFVVRDLSIVVGDSLPAAIIRGTILAANNGQPAPLSGLTFFDRYRGKGVPEGSISMSIRLTFQSPDRTLTDAEVQASFDTILAALVREHAAIQR